MALRQKGCTVKGQWTPSHLGIYENEQADTLATQGGKEPPCPDPKCSITLLKSRSKTLLLEQWATGTPTPRTPIEIGPNSHLGGLPRYQATAILRLLTWTTNHHESFFNLSPQCDCGHAASARHTLLDCPLWCYECDTLRDASPPTWEHLTTHNPLHLKIYVKSTTMVKREMTRTFTECISSSTTIKDRQEGWTNSFLCLLPHGDGLWFQAYHLREQGSTQDSCFFVFPFVALLFQVGPHLIFPYLEIGTW